LYFIEALIDLIVQEPLIVVVWRLFLFITLLGLSAAIAFRQFWAYTASIVILILIFLTMILDVASGLAAVDLLQTQSGLAYFEALADNGLITFISPVLELIGPFQMLAILLALLYGLFKAGPDFERVKLRRLARVDKGLGDASSFYSAGKRHAQEKMWATAVLYFQRAAANEPNRAYYHLATGKAFAQLGFNERAMDAYQSAQRLALNDELKTEIASLIVTLQSNHIIAP
jgi:tetratricopeptide (TPR) repeat protein